MYDRNGDAEKPQKNGHFCSPIGRECAGVRNGLGLFTVVFCPGRLHTANGPTAVKFQGVSYARARLSGSVARL